MGLDWSPLARPKTGHEAEFESVFLALQRLEQAPKPGLLARLFTGRGAGKPAREELVARFQAISEPPYAVLGAPRVGHDDAADRWLLEQLEQQGKAADFDKARAEMRGYCVLELLPECDGFPVYSNGGLYQGVDRCSFRGAFLRDVEDVLGPELMNRAYEKMLAKDLAAFGAALHAKASAFAKAHGVEAVEQVRAADFELETDASRAHILFSAAKWCRYWAERGHGLEPWF